MILSSARTARATTLFFEALKQAVAGFDRQIAGATHKCRLKRRFSDLSEAIFDSDFGETLMSLRTRYGRRS